MVPLQDAPGAKSDLYAHNVLINGLSKVGRMAEAESYLEMATLIAQQEGVALPIEGFGAVVKASQSPRPPPMPRKPATPVPGTPAPHCRDAASHCCKLLPATGLPWQASCAER